MIVGDCGFDHKKLLILPVTLEKPTSCFKDFYEKWQPLRPPSRSQPAQIGDIYNSGDTPVPQGTTRYGFLEEKSHTSSPESSGINSWEIVG